MNVYGRCWSDWERVTAAPSPENLAMTAKQGSSHALDLAKDDEGTTLQSTYGEMKEMANLVMAK